MWWDCPEWICWLLSNHALSRRWANYNTDQSGLRCNCGRFFTDDCNPGVLHDYKDRSDPNR